MNFKLFTKLLLLLSLVMAMSLSSKAITLTSPENGDDCVPENPILKWVAMQNIQEYIVEIADDVEFTNIIYTKDGIGADTDTADVELYGTALFWRVIAVDLEDDKDTSEVRTFTTRLQTPPAVTADDLTCTELKLDLEWLDVAEIYSLQVSLVEDFSSLVLNSNNLDTNVVSVEVDLYDTTYFWRVSAFFDDCRTNWNLPRSFKTKKAPIELIAPADNVMGVALRNDTLANSIIASWQALEGAEFKFQAATDSVFSLESIIVEADLDTNVIEIEVPQENNQEFYWRVGYSMEECFSEWSEIFSFRTEYEPVITLMPMEQDTCVDYEMASFCWNSLIDSGMYRLQIASDISFADTLMLLDSAMIQDTCFNYSLGLENSVFYWRVRADDSTNYGEWSQIFMNRTIIAPPALISPINNVGGIDIEALLTWEDLLDTNYRYHLQVSEFEDNFALNVLDTMYLASNEFTVTLTEKFKQYFWRVRVMNPDSCWSPWSAVESFRTNIAAPILIEPANEAVNINVGIIWYEWAPVEGATEYLLQVSSDEDFDNILDEEANLDQTRNILLDFTYSENTKYYWRVRAINQDGQSDWSETFEFTTWVRIPDVPQLIFPEANATRIDKNVELRWSDDPRATFWVVEVFDDVYLENKIVEANSDTNTYQLNNLKTYTRYYWRVKAVNAAGESNWSVNFNFRTINEIPTDKAVILMPENNVDEQDLTIKFDWEDVEFALNYWIELSKDINFGDIEFKFESIPESDKLVYGLEYGTKYYWHVKAWNTEGDGPWSDTYTFTTKLDLSVSEEFTKELGLNLYPNPANSIAQLEFNSPVDGAASIVISDASGKVITTLFDGYLLSGNHSYSVNTDNLSSGVYYYTVNISGKIAGGVFVVAK